MVFVTIVASRERKQRENSILKLFKKEQADTANRTRQAETLFLNKIETINLYVADHIKTK